MLISAFAFGGIPRSAVRKAFTETEIWASPQLLREYRDTPLELEAKGKITRPQLKSLLSGIAAFVAKARVVVPEKRLFLCRDTADNMILDCCLAAQADFLITGDRDLLDMDRTTLKVEISKLTVLSPGTFLKRF